MVTRFQDIRVLLLLGIVYCVAYCLNFDWFFQGVQEMKHLTYLNLLARLFSLIWVFTMVKSSKDMASAFLTVPLSYLITGLVSLGILKVKYKVSFCYFKWAAAWGEIKRGFHIFYAQMLVRFYSADVNITLLGFLADSTTVGVFALANRIFGLFMVATNLITVIVFPYLASLYKSNVQAYNRRTVQVYKFTFVVFALLSLAVFVCAPWLVSFVNGSPNAIATTCLQILSVALLLSPFAPLNNQIFIISNSSKWLAVIASFAVLFNIGLFFPAYKIFGLQGLAIVNVIVFTLLISSGIIILRRQQIFFTGKKEVKG
jgi:PST family polysaccharide transporter